MDFIYVVGFIALVYVIITRVLNRIMMDNSRMKEFREKMDKLNKEFKEASKRNDVEKMNKIYEEQKKLFPMMGGAFKDQLKMMGIILVVFYISMWFIGYLNPFIKDDISISLINASGFYSLQIHLDRGGLWHINYDVDTTKGHFKGTISFYVGDDDNINVHPSFSSNEFTISVDKPVYKEGEIAILRVNGKIKKYHIVADRGTYISLKLPFSIFGVKEISGASSVFITIVILLGLVEGLVLRRIFKY